MSYKSSLTVLFESPFWIGLYECFENDKYGVCKIAFGAEAKDYEVYDFMFQNWHILKFCPPVKTEKAIDRIINSKRIRHEIIGTKA